MSSITVVNIKCGGCENKIKTSLEKAGLSEIQIDIPSQTISFQGDENVAEKKLSSMGYPKAGSKAAKSFLKKSKSYLSCAIGRLK